MTFPTVLSNQMPSLFVFLLANANAPPRSMHSCLHYAIAMMAVWSQQLKIELEGKIAISLQIVPVGH